MSTRPPDNQTHAYAALVAECDLPGLPCTRTSEVADVPVVRISCCRSSVDDRHADGDMRMATTVPSHLDVSLQPLLSGARLAPRMHEVWHAVLRAPRSFG